MMVTHIRYDDVKISDVRLLTSRCSWRAASVFSALTTHSLPRSVKTRFLIDCIVTYIAQVTAVCLYSCFATQIRLSYGRNEECKIIARHLEVKCSLYKKFCLDDINTAKNHHHHYDHNQHYCYRQHHHHHYQYHSPHHNKYVTFLTSESISAKCGNNKISQFLSYSTYSKQFPWNSSPKRTYINGSHSFAYEKFQHFSATFHDPQNLFVGLCRSPAMYKYTDKQ